MRLILLLLLAGGLMWAALHPDEFVSGAYRLKHRADLLLGRTHAVEYTPEQVRGQAAFREWQKDPVHDIDSLEALYLDTGHRMFLVHLAAATAKGCGEAYESRVLAENLDRIPTRWTGKIEVTLAEKARRCDPDP